MPATKLEARVVRRIGVIWLSLIMIISCIVFPLNNELTKASQISDNYDYVPHAQIVITSNSGFTPANGVTGGDGSAGNPWIIENFEISDSGYSFDISGTTDHFWIRNCLSRDGHGGVRLQNVINGKIDGIIIHSHHWEGIYLINSHYITIVNNTPYDNNYAGVCLEYSSNNLIKNNQPTALHGHGISLWGSNDNIITSNDIFDANMHGIYSYNSSNNDINNNTIGNNGYDGIHIISNSVNNKIILNNLLSHDPIIIGGNNNQIISNQVNTFGEGITIYSNNNLIMNNILGNCRNGICLAGAINNIVTGNLLTNQGISLYGSLIEHWNSHVIDTSNLINNQPVYYLKNTNGITVPSGRVQIILANCSDISIWNQNLLSSGGLYIGFSDQIRISDTIISTSNEYGLYLYMVNQTSIWDNVFSDDYRAGCYLKECYDVNIHNNTFLHNGVYQIQLKDSSFITIDNNTIDDGWRDGIRIETSDDNVIKNNNIKYNWGTGLVFVIASRNCIKGNNISQNEDGIRLWSSSNDNEIRKNTIMDNINGVFISSSNDNSISGNDFIFNLNQSSDFGSNNWDDGYPTGGNFWSDYTGLDINTTANQNVPPADGIGDTPYTNIGGSAGAQDNYPLMNPIGFVNNPPDSYVNPIDPYWQSNTSIILGVNATDDYNGIYNVTLWFRSSIDNTTWGNWIKSETDTSEPWSYNFNYPLGDGYYEFYSIAVDKTYLIESDPLIADSSCIFDTLAPTTTMTIGTPQLDRIVENNTYTYVNASTEINLKAVDNGTGVNKTWYRIFNPWHSCLGEGRYVFFSIEDGGWTNWTEYTGNFTISGTIDDIYMYDNIIYVEFYSSDLFGHNETIQNTTVILDKNGPFTNLDAYPFNWVSPGAISYVNPNSIFTLSAVDMATGSYYPGVGLDSIWYRIWNGSEWTVWTEYTSNFSLTGEEGEYNIEYYSIDDFGQLDDLQNDTFFLDKTNPYIVATTPDINSVGVNINTEVIIHFSEEIEWMSYYNDLVNITPALNHTCQMWSSGNAYTGLRILLFENLTKNTTYTISLQSGVVDMSYLPVLDDYTFTFTTWQDNDDDGLPDDQDPDDDNDGIPDTEDDFPFDQTETVDTDEDGIGDNADPDDDNDGVNDDEDAFPLDPTEWADADGDGIGDNADPDDDNDGIPDVEEEEQEESETPGGFNYLWLALILVVVAIIAGLLVLTRAKPELMTETCPQCGFEIEPGGACPFCAMNEVEPPPKSEPKPVSKPEPALKPKSPLSTEQKLANLRKAFEEGRMSEEMYLKNVERLRKS